MAFHFKLHGIEVRCDSAAELREALTAEGPAPGGAGGEEGGATQATTREVANQATGTNGSNGHHSNGNGQRSLEDLKVEELPLLDSPLAFEKVRRVIKQLHLPEDTDQRTMRTMLKRRQELANA